VALYGAIGAARRDPALAHGLNTVGGRYANAIVAESLGAVAIDALAPDA
jgi:alanine dehydrogenase